MSQPDTHALIRSLRGRLCPACGKVKRAGQTVCPACWRKLPPAFREPLYDRVGEGYEQAFTDAMRSLGVDEPRFEGAP
ncbi:MAG: double zinc ribbon domain-containing protein [Planctomycetota bacterium]